MLRMVRGIWAGQVIQKTRIRIRILYVVLQHCYRGEEEDCVGGKKLLYLHRELVFLVVQIFPFFFLSNPFSPLRILNKKILKNEQYNPHFFLLPIYFSSLSLSLHPFFFNSLQRKRKGILIFLPSPFLSKITKKKMTDEDLRTLLLLHGASAVERAADSRQVASAVQGLAVKACRVVWTGDARPDGKDPAVKIAGIAAGALLRWCGKNNVDNNVTPLTPRTLAATLTSPEVSTITTSCRAAATALGFLYADALELQTLCDPHHKPPGKITTLTRLADTPVVETETEVAVLAGKIHCAQQQGATEGVRLAHMAREVERVGARLVVQAGGGGGGGTVAVQTLLGSGESRLALEEALCERPVQTEAVLGGKVFVECFMSVITASAAVLALSSEGYPERILSSILSGNCAAIVAKNRFFCDIDLSLLRAIVSTQGIVVNPILLPFLEDENEKGAPEEWTVLEGASIASCRLLGRAVAEVMGVQLGAEDTELRIECEVQVHEAGNKQTADILHTVDLLRLLALPQHRSRIPPSLHRRLHLNQTVFSILLDSLQMAGTILRDPNKFRAKSFAAFAEGALVLGGSQTILKSTLDLLGAVGPNKRRRIEKRGGSDLVEVFEIARATLKVGRSLVDVLTTWCAHAETNLGAAVQDLPPADLLPALLSLLVAIYRKSSLAPPPLPSTPFADAIASWVFPKTKSPSNTVQLQQRHLIIKGVSTVYSQLAIAVRDGRTAVVESPEVLQAVRDLLRKGPWVLSPRAECILDEVMCGVSGWKGGTYLAPSVTLLPLTYDVRELKELARTLVPDSDVVANALISSQLDACMGDIDKGGVEKKRAALQLRCGIPFRGR